MKLVISKMGPKVLFPWDYIGKGTEGKVYKKKIMLINIIMGLLTVLAYH